jgi:hypothetical protein
MTNDDKAVTETMGYIILFAIVLTAIAIILLFGNSILDAEKNKNNFKNIEQGFSIIQSDLKQVALEGTPNKSIMIHMEGGTILSNTDTGRLKIDYHNTHYNNYTGQIVFKSPNDLSSITIENGGVFEKSNEEGTDALVSKPRMYITPQTNTLVLNVIKVKASPLSNSGRGNLNINLMYNDTSVYQDSLADGTVTLTIDTQYPNAWHRYLDDMMKSAGSTVPDPVHVADGYQYTLSPVNNLMIVEHDIDAWMGGIII